MSYQQLHNNKIIKKNRAEGVKEGRTQHYWRNTLPLKLRDNFGN